MKQKYFKKVILIIMFVVLFLLLGTKVSRAAQHLDNLDFEAKIDSSGDMQVTEIWDIDISNTNTLFKTFKEDKNKYTDIRNVRVTDITNNQSKNLRKIHTEMYHVTKDSYYALKNKENLFEIAWGVGLDNSREKRKYKIEYTVRGAIAKYNDCAELYWQFLGDDFKINADKINGTIILPTNANSKEDIKVWGHIKTLNGTIYATENNKVEFSIDKYNRGNYLEVRVAMPTNMIEISSRTYDTDKLNSIIKEESVWAEKANKQRKNEKILNIIRKIIEVIIIIILIIKIIKSISILVKTKNIKPTMKFEYYRELPYEDATPAKAIYILKNRFSNFNSNIGKIFSATILSLSLKKVIEISMETGKKGKDEAIIKVLDKNPSNLPEDEKVIFNFIKNSGRGKDTIPIKKIEQYIKDYPTKAEELSDNLHKLVENDLAKTEKIDIEAKNKKAKYQSRISIYFWMSIFAINIFNSTILILLIINMILSYLVSIKINVLKQKGVDEQEKWKAFKKYMEKFSLLKDKEAPSLTVWEHYLVFATAFGISKKVLKQLKVIYPEINDNDKINTYSTLYVMTNMNFYSSLGRSINSSFSSALSSGSGSGGGFSGGGGGRTEEAGGGGGR